MSTGRDQLGRNAGEGLQGFEEEVAPGVAGGLEVDAELLVADGDGAGALQFALASTA